MSKKKHSVLKVLAILGSAVLTTEAINRFIFTITAKKNPLSNEDGNFCSWKHGDFYYKKKEGGNGRPILILHDLYPDRCADNVEELACALSQRRTVYTMDLLGCGRSAKPAITYTNFLYVLQVTEMIEKVIGQPAHLVAEGRSSAIACAACHYKPEYFAQITLMDPSSEEENKKIPDRESRLKKKLIELPVLGTLVYNIAFLKSPAAHMGGVSARYLYASIVGLYTNYDVSWMLAENEIPIRVMEGDHAADKG